MKISKFSTRNGIAIFPEGKAGLQVLTNSTLASTGILTGDGQSYNSPEKLFDSL